MTNEQKIATLVQVMNEHNSKLKFTPYLGVEITESRRKYHLLNNVLSNGQRSGLYLIDKVTHDVYKSKGYGVAGKCVGTVESVTEFYRKA